MNGNLNENYQELLDSFAMSALNALIAKMPFYDSKSEFGKSISADDLREIKKDLSATAYEYAQYMLIERENTKTWLKKNLDNQSHHEQDI